MHNWENEVGDKFYVLGEIIGIRGSSFKINNFFDWEFLEKHENSKKIEGRYIVIKQSIKDDISIWTDFFGRVITGQKHLQLLKSQRDKKFSKHINKESIDQIGLSQALTIYGSRPLKKHTLFNGINRLGVQEKLIVDNNKISISKLKFESRNFQKVINLNWFTLIFSSSSKADIEKQNIVLSSGWDSTSIQLL